MGKNTVPASLCTSCLNAQICALLQYVPTNAHLPNCLPLLYRFQAVSLGILYHISMEDSHKSLFVYTQPPAMTTIFDRLLQLSSEELRAEAELIALAVNLTQNPRCAAQLVEGSKFDRLMKHALELQDDLLFKVLRNVSQVRTCRCCACPADMPTNLIRPAFMDSGCCPSGTFVTPAVLVACFYRMLRGRVLLLVLSRVLVLRDCLLQSRTLQITTH